MSDTEARTIISKSDNILKLLEKYTYSKEIFERTHKTTLPRNSFHVLVINNLQAKYNVLLVKLRTIHPEVLK